MDRLREARNAARGGGLDDSASAGSRGSRSNRLTYALLAAIGVVAVAYLVGRRRGESDGSVAVPDAIERAEEATLEHAQKIPIGSPGGRDTAGAEPDEGGGGAAGGGETESADDGPDGADLSVDLDDDRSPEEIDEMAESNAQEAPAEPGEVRIDEEVAAEVADEEDESTADESADEE